MQHHHFNIQNRRSFLSTLGKAGMLAALGSVTDIPMVLRRALAEGTIARNGKKLLFIWLRGANDSLNSVIPIRDTQYALARPNIRIPMDVGGDAFYAATGGCDFTPSGNASTYGSYPYAIRLGNGFSALHPSLKFLADIYNAGDLALVHRVGYPKQSRSHFDSQNYWENGNPNNNLVKSGIFYRTMLESGFANTDPISAVSVQNSLPLILRGDEAAMTNLTDPERYALLGIPNDPNGIAKAGSYLTSGGALKFAPKQNRDLLELQYKNLNGTLALFDSIAGFAEAENTFRDNIASDGDSDWANAFGGGYYLFPTTNDKNGGWRRTPGGAVDGNKYVVNPGHQGFFKNLKAAALVLNKTDATIAGTELGGFDTHTTQGVLTGSHPDLQRAIGWAMYSLYKYFTLYADRATWDNTVVVTLSEFGRTSRENTDAGTDHGEANVTWVAGGSVKGYNAGNPSGVFNCHTGDAIPWQTGPSGSMFQVSGSYLKRTTDFRSVLGEIIRKHLGATQNQLNRIIPGYAVAGERLLGGGISSIDGTQIRGEAGIL